MCRHGYRVKSGVSVWTQWREKSLSRLTPQISHIVLTDITGYYENIDIPRLVSDLKAFGVLDSEVQLLSNCLRRWSIPRLKGIPQGYTASDVLAKVYLHPIDQALRNDGFDHLRYVDDMRVFCQSQLNAKRAVIRLTELMSQRGLNLQSAKTKIRTKTEAKPEIEGIAEKLQDVNQKLLTEIKGATAEGKYIPDYVLFSFLAKKKSLDSPPEVLEKTFDESFSTSSDQEFNKTLFHFLLTRLAAVGSRVAVDYSLHILNGHPEETGYILRYFAAVSLSLDELHQLHSLLESPELIYDYQIFEIVRWFFDNGIPSDRVLALSRTWAYDHNRDLWLRTYAISYLGAYGNQSDLDKIEQQYPAADSGLERATYVAALERLEVGRRNAFYAKVKSDSDLVRPCDQSREGKGVMRRA